MKRFQVTFTPDEGGTFTREEVRAEDITAAYLETIYKHDKNIIITSLKEIKTK